MGHLIGYRGCKARASSFRSYHLKYRYWVPECFCFLMFPGERTFLLHTIAHYALRVKSISICMHIKSSWNSSWNLLTIHNDVHTSRGCSNNKQWSQIFQTKLYSAQRHISHSENEWNKQYCSTQGTENPQIIDKIRLICGRKLPEKCSVSHIMPMLNF